MCTSIVLTVKTIRVATENVSSNHDTNNSKLITKTHYPHNRKQRWTRILNYGWKHSARNNTGKNGWLKYRRLSHKRLQWLLWSFFLKRWCAQIIINSNPRTCIWNVGHLFNIEHTQKTSTWLHLKYEHEKK